MSPFILLAILFFVAAVVFDFVFNLTKKPLLRKISLIGLPLSYVAFLLFFLLFMRKIYAEDNVTYATFTYLFAGLALGCLLAAPIFRKNKIITYILMPLFLGFGVAFIVMSVYLSKSILQPGAGVFSSALFF